MQRSTSPPGGTWRASRAEREEEEGEWLAARRCWDCRPRRAFRFPCTRIDVDSQLRTRVDADPSRGSVRSLDRILSDPTLNLRDHLSLACVCRSLRACYYTPHAASLAPFVCPPSALWAGLCLLRPSPEYNAARRVNAAAGSEVTDEMKRAVGMIWTNGVWVDARRMQVVKTVRVGGGGSGGKKGGGKNKRKADEMEQEVVQVVRSYEWERAIKLVHALVSSASARLARDA